ncbi:MAG: LL-diaminopimelate aminotransferase [Planctomycetota bacterium]
MQINDHYLKLAAGYLFPEIARRVKAFTEAHADALKDKPIVKLGIGDVTEPLPEACRTAMIRAVNEMGKHDQFRGYGPEQGYAFLREAIATNDYQQRGCDIDADEVFVSDGSKCDSANILDILGPTNTTAVCDPVYPVYVDTNVMAGHTGPVGDDGRYGGLVYLPMTVDNAFTPPIPDEAVDVVYLCSPNNPTGSAMTHDQLAAWVKYANENKTLILFDAAYAAFIQDDTLPRSIYEVPGARTCAIEFRSFSKTAGFTGTRCAYTVVPKELVGQTPGGDEVALHGLWSRRQSTKFNGVSYIVQRGAESIYSDEGKAEVAALVAFYMDNAKLIREGLAKAGITTYGGEHAPYVWVKAPEGTTSWGLFDRLLYEAHVVGTPGAGFGSCGEGYFRLSAFNSRANVETAIERVTAGVAV